MDIEDIHTIQGVRQDDIIIAFMGLTGVGKSYFIDLLTGQIGQRAGDSLTSVTDKIQATRVRHPNPKLGNRVVLVDTPGFDDTTKSDVEVLEMISEWLTKTYKRDIRLSGLIYLHRITDNRMTGSLHKNLRMFGKLCGDHATKRVTLVSTMWEKLTDQAVGEKREEQLCAEFWNKMIEKGTGIDRLEKGTREEAWRIVEKLAKNAEERDAVLLQEEMVDLRHELNETEAGKTLYTELQRLLADQKLSLKSLLAQVEKSGGDPKLKEVLEKEYKKVQVQFERTLKGVDKLKIPLGRRIKLFFGRIIRAKAIKAVGNRNR